MRELLTEWKKYLNEQILPTGKGGDWMLSSKTTEGEAIKFPVSMGVNVLQSEAGESYKKAMIDAGVDGAEAEARSQQVMGVIRKAVIDPAIKQIPAYEMVKHAIGDHVVEPVFEALGLTSETVARISPALAWYFMLSDLYKITQAWKKWQEVSAESNVQRVAGLKYLRLLDSAFQEYYYGADGNTRLLSIDRCIDPVRSNVATGKVVYKAFKFYKNTPQNIINFLNSEETDICVQGQIIELPPLTEAYVNRVRRNITKNIDKTFQSLSDCIVLTVSADRLEDAYAIENKYQYLFRFLKEHLPEWYNFCKQRIQDGANPKNRENYLKLMVQRFRTNEFTKILEDYPKFKWKCALDKESSNARDVMDYEKNLIQFKKGMISFNREPYTEKKLLNINECAQAAIYDKYNPVLQNYIGLLKQIIQKDNQDTNEARTILANYGFSPNTAGSVNPVQTATDNLAQNYTPYQPAQNKSMNTGSTIQTKNSTPTKSQIKKTT